MNINSNKWKIMSSTTSMTDTRSSIRRSMSLPLLDSQNDPGNSYSIGSCGDLKSLMKPHPEQQRLIKVKLGKKI
jgi:hypothetical protein